MKTIKSVLVIFSIVISVVGLCSCSDDGEYDFPGETVNRIFVRDCSATFDIIQTSVGAIHNFSCDISAGCTSKAASDIHVTFVIDNSLIAAYNETNGTNYESLPSEFLLLENSIVTIPQGEVRPLEPFKIRFTDDNALLSELTSDNGFLIPVVAKDFDGGNAVFSSNVNHVTYITVNVVEDNVNHGAGAESAKGSLVKDRSGWTAYATIGQLMAGANYKVENIFDDNETTSAWFLGVGNKAPVQFVVDLGRPYTFDAVTMYAKQGSIKGSFADGVDIEVGTDGAEWQNIAELDKSDNTITIVFYGPITARYLRFTHHSMYYFQIGYFNIYEI